MEQQNTLSNTRLRTNGSRTFICSACLLFVLVSASVGIAEDWPTYRFCITRSGSSPETIGWKLFLQWKYTPAHAPKPAWPMPAEELPRMHRDNAYHVAVADGSVYFGSSVTNKVYAIDVASGKIRWTFFTQGPVRFAPTVWNQRLYVGSDDGYVYCLDAKDGKLIWKYLAGPGDEKVIGNGRMISLWPVRTSVLVDNGIAYFAPGVFPYEGIYICALDADDGSVIWKNDTIGDHAHELEFGGISPQGYLIASKDILYVPSGRAMPAAFDRKSGKFLFYASPSGKRGGTWALLDNDRLIAGVDSSGTPYKAAYDVKTGLHREDVFARFHGIDMVITRDVSYVLTKYGIYAFNRLVYSKAVKKANRLAKERKTLGRKLSELRKKLTKPEEETRGEIDQQIDRITASINKLAEEEKRLKDSSFKWHYFKKGLGSLIMTGDYLFAGGDGFLVGINPQTGKEVWKADVSGKAAGLAAAGGRLIVSTDKGLIYCFGKEKISEPENIKMASNPSPYREDEAAALYESAAEKIVKETSVNKGYCLVLDCGTGRLAFELAKRTELQIVGIEKNRNKLAIARKNLEAAGLLGARVVVEPWDIAVLPDYFANLIVSDGMLTSGKTAAPRDHINRLLRPCGGVSLLGSRRLLSRKISWNKFVRGKLEGAGSWTQLYANPQNTACSGDKLVKGSFGVLWFGEPGPQRMVERHGRAASPVSMNGRLFVQGEEVIMAYDAYNGTFLWEKQITGAVRVRADVDGGNLALTEDALYVAARDKCYRLDPATGKTIRSYEVPASPDGTPRRWGYISCTDGILFGVTAMPLKMEYAAEYKANLPLPKEKAQQIQRDGILWGYNSSANFPSWNSRSSPKNVLTNRLMSGDTIFAMEPQTGRLIWRYRGEKIPNISVTIADGTVFFIEAAATKQQKAKVLKEKQSLLKKGIYIEAEREEYRLKDEDADVRLVVALDAATGKTLWKKPLDLTGCGGDKAGSAYADGLLLFFGHCSNHDQNYFKKGQLTWGRITALSAKTGEVLWSRPLNYLRRPLVVGDKIIVEPRACNLYTGETITRSHPITGKQVPWEFLRPGHSCGVVSASADTLFYRSYWTAIYEFTADKGLSLFGAIRPGCWLNQIPAGGLMLMPEASSGCTCSYPLRCSLALVHKPGKVTGNWTIFISPGAATPVKHLAVNLGAPGDMKDKDGIVWFGYPRPKKTVSVYNAFPQYGVRFNLSDKFAPGMGYFCRDYKGVSIAATDKPWLFTSGCQGLLRCELPLIDDSDGQKPATYTVRLGFNALPEDLPGRRIFDIKLQNQRVLNNFDILQTAGKSNKAVIKEFKAIRVENNLVLELVPKVENPKLHQAQIINFIEAIREDKGGTAEMASVRY